MFTSDAALALTTLFSFANDVFSVTVPGTNISFRALFLSILITSFIIGMIQHMFGIFSVASDKVTGQFEELDRKYTKSEMQSKKFKGFKNK